MRPFCFRPRLAVTSPLTSRQSTHTTKARGRRTEVVTCIASLVATLSTACVTRAEDRASSSKSRLFQHVGTEQSSTKPLKDEELVKVKRLLDDPEVSFIRSQQAKLKLFNTAKGVFETLPELLQPGKPMYDADIVCIGELHDSGNDHAVQRLLLDALTYKLFVELRTEEGLDPALPRGRTPQQWSPQRVALGVEYFSRQQQSTLDELIYGQGDKSASSFRSRSDWDNVWQYDWALYAPTFRFCQLNLTRLIGLNIPYEAVQMVARDGIQSVPTWLKELLPEMDLSQQRHRRRFEDMLRMPLEEAVARMSLPVNEGAAPQPKLDGAYAAQVLWDEYMADSAHQYLESNPGRLVVLAGSNHVWRDAIPDRFERRSATSIKPRRAVSIIPWHGNTDPALLPRDADYILCMHGPGGGDEIASALAAQRQRLAGKSRVFPAGYV